MSKNYFIERLISFVFRKINLISTIIHCSLCSSFSYKKENFLVNNFLKKITIIRKIKKINNNLLKNYLSHNFNLLGSGFKNLNLKKKDIGINLKNQKIYNEISNIVPNKNYKWLNWQIDFRSNYQWNSKELSKRIKFMNIPHADIKIPWEFARMQHVPQMAIYASKIKIKDINTANKIFKEFESQVIDFIIANPPEYGVNWICTMDVSIRVANLLMARDIFNSSGFIFSKSIEGIFFSSVNDHKKFILRNLEYSSYRGNHYLSNICGLAIIARYLPEDIYSDNMIAFIAQELNKEIFFQFNKDGSNIEGSTSYHKFSLEMLFYSTAILLSFSRKRLIKIKEIINPNLIRTNFISPILLKNSYKLYKIKKKLFNQNFISPFPEKYFNQLLNVYNFFLKTVTRNNEVIQVGDNDSGKFFNFTPLFYYNNINNSNKKNYFESRERADYIFAIANSWGLFSGLKCRKKIFFEEYLFRELLGKIRFKKNIHNIHNIQKSKNINTSKSYIKKFYCLKNKILKDKQFYKTKYTYIVNHKYINRIKLTKFKDFGLYIWKTQKFFFTLRLITKYKKRFSSHYHFDQLSNILIINNKNKIIDPGTYTYSANRKYRNFFRSYKAHFTPINVKLKSNTEIFAKIDLPKPEILLLNENCYLIKVIINKNVYYSGFIIKKNKINIYHLSNKKTTNYKKTKYKSPGYGLLIK